MSVLAEADTSVFAKGNSYYCMTNTGWQHFKPTPHYDKLVSQSAFSRLRKVSNKCKIVNTIHVCPIMISIFVLCIKNRQCVQT